MVRIMVTALEGKTIDRKRKLIQDITDAVCKNYNCTSESVTVEIREIKKENLGRDRILYLDR